MTVMGFVRTDYLSLQISWQDTCMTNTKLRLTAQSFWPHTRLLIAEMYRINIYMGMSPLPHLTRESETLSFDLSPDSSHVNTHHTIIFLISSGRDSQRTKTLIHPPPNYRNLVKLHEESWQINSAPFVSLSSAASFIDASGKKDQCSGFPACRHTGC